MISSSYQDTENDEKQVDDHRNFPGREVDQRHRNQLTGIRVPDEAARKTGISGQAGGRVDDD